MTVTAAPTLAWTRSLNGTGSGGTVTACHQSIAYQLKTQLVSAGATVASSSNGTSSGAADYWSSSSDITFAAGAHSWIVLSFSWGQLCIDFASATQNRATLVCDASSGFSGGTTSARPTATNEVAFRAAATDAWINGAASTTARINVQVSSRGLFVWFYRAGAADCTWIIQQLTSGTPGYAGELLGTVITSSSEANLINTNVYARHSGTTLSACRFDVHRINTTAAVASTSINLVNEVDSTSGYPCFPIGVMSTSGTTGGMGVLTDVWCIPNGPAEGDHSEVSSGSKDWVAHGNLLLPWGSGTAAATT